MKKKKKHKIDTYQIYRVNDEADLLTLSTKFSFHAGRRSDEERLLLDTIDLALQDKISLYVLVNMKSQKYMGVIGLCFWSFDIVTMTYISFVFVDMSYRKKKYILGGSSQKVSSYLVKTFAIGITNNINESIPLKSVFLMPINDEVKNTYMDMGYIEFPDDPNVLVVQ